MFGVQLGVPLQQLKAIETQGGKKDLNMCMELALENWLQTAGVQHTWEKIIETANSCDNRRLANNLQMKYSRDLRGERLLHISILQQLIVYLFIFLVELTEEHLKVMLNELQDMVAQWFTFCLFLGVNETQLRIIEDSTTATKCTTMMLSQWVNNHGATVHAILDTLRSPIISNPALAMELEKNNPKIKELLQRR